jgi:hypothetical protein
MKSTIATAITSTALALVLAPATPPTADALTALRPGQPRVTVTVPDQLVEGERFDVVVKVGRARDAKQILLQQLQTDIYGQTGWETVRKAKVRGQKKRTFHAVAGTDDSQRYRARVIYDDARPAMSRPVASTVWHWTDMMAFTAYAVTNGISSNHYNHFRMNGIEYHGGWYTYISYATWELRFTPGRHCKAFRGVAGLTDESKDGSSGAIQLVADETTTAFSSTTLTPGMDQPFQVDLATPYRLFIEAQKTSPADQAAYPAIGNPELLCTGLG